MATELLKADFSARASSVWAFFVPICVGKKERKKVFLLRQGTWISILIGSWQSWRETERKEVGASSASFISEIQWSYQTPLPPVSAF